jgi:hypothetical protein
MSKFIDVVSNGSKHSIDVSKIIFVQEINSQETAIFFMPSGNNHCVYVKISYEDVMKLIRE